MHMLRDMCEDGGGEPLTGYFVLVHVDVGSGLLGNFVVLALRCRRDGRATEIAGLIQTHLGSYLYIVA